MTPQTQSKPEDRGDAPARLPQAPVTDGRRLFRPADPAEPQPIFTDWASI
jgi:hypothetical protein